MMNGPEKSDPGIVAMKPANKTEQSVAEPVERRAGTKGNADQQSTCRTQSRISVSQALERIRKGTLCRQTPEVGAVCGKAARTVLCGGRSAMSVPTASEPFLLRCVESVVDAVDGSSTGTRVPKKWARLRLKGPALADERALRAPLKGRATVRHETARIHHPPRRRGARMSTRSARAAG